MKNASAEILIASSETDANLYYATRFLVPDPVLFIKIKNKKFLILNDLELDRGRNQAQVDEVFSLSRLNQKIQKEIHRSPTTADTLIWFLKDKGVGQATLPYDFPAYFAAELQKKRIKIQFRKDPFFKERIYKTPSEKEAVKLSLKHTGNAIRRAYEVLEMAQGAPHPSRRKGENALFFKGEPLTSERLRYVIDSYLLEMNCLAQNTIVAGGDQAIDPHNRGSGPLYTDRSIVMDVFPRSMETQYYADMTRTVVKGKPSLKLKKIWHAVKEAQERAIGQIKAGIKGSRIHQGILDFFEKRGFKSGNINGRMQGFFHGTGHGLGLDIHEAPRISKHPIRLEEGMVVTVEPGLYYQDIGGVRIEDVVYVTGKGCEVLSKCPKILSIE